MSTDQTGTQDKLDASAALAAQEISRDTLLEKYAKGKESSIEEVRRREIGRASCRERVFRTV